MEDPNFVLIDLHAQGNVKNRTAEGPAQAQKSSPCKWQASLDGKEVVLIPMKDMLLESNKDQAIKKQTGAVKESQLTKEDIDAGVNLYFHHESVVQEGGAAANTFAVCSPVGNKHVDIPAPVQVQEEAIEPDRQDVGVEQSIFSRIPTLSGSRLQATLAALLLLSSAWLLSQAKLFVVFN